MQTVRRVAAILVGMTVAMVLLTSPSHAQVTGSVTGFAQDARGGRIPGAIVSLTSESRGTKLPDVVTNSNGEYTFVNVPADTYTLQISLDGFKPVKRTGVAVSPGDRVPVPALVMEVGGRTEVVDVTAEAPQIQSQSGERSFAITSQSVDNLPIANRGFSALAALAPGVSGTSRLGGGGSNNLLIDGGTVVDSGNNGILVQVNVENIAEVKVLVSNYQAEYGRSSGLQIAAVTKSGTNRLRGAIYDVSRNSKWNSRTKESLLNGDPASTNISKTSEIGYSIGGPVGKPGGANKLFFFYAHEFQPRTQGLDIQRFRVPTDLERQGDFSQSRDNNGALFPFIKDPLLTGACNAASQVACFADGGVVGRIPKDRLYQLGLNILNIYPRANLANPPSGASYNLEYTRPKESMLAQQPGIRIDYQPTERLRATVRYTGWRQPNSVILGTAPGFNDSKQQNTHAYQATASLNYTINQSTFLEALYARGSDEESGCAIGVSSGGLFCRNGMYVNPIANKFNAGLGALPSLFPDAGLMDQRYYAYRALNEVNDRMDGKLPIWDAAQGRLVQTPSFAWGSRIGTPHPNIAFPGYLLDLGLDDYSGSLTKVKARHTLKTGIYVQRSQKEQQRNGAIPTYNFANSTSNPIDTGFGYANAAIGVFNQVSQSSHYVEGTFIFHQIEGYVQDNWKLTNRLTLDYGIRLVHQEPQYDHLLQGSNFLPEKWVASQAPRLYTAGCANGVYPCTGTNRQAMDPVSGQFLGPNTTVQIGTIIPGTGNRTNGLFKQGQGIVDSYYTWPAVKVAPRVGVAFDLSSNQTFVLRGGFGTFFDRPSGNSVFSTVGNPPALENVAVNFGDLRTLGTSGLTTLGPPSLSVFEYEGKNLPTSAQWNVGIQKTLPWSIAVDAEYVGTHSFDQYSSRNLNNIDLGTLFRPEVQDKTVTPTVLGSNTISTDEMRTYRGFAAINQQFSSGGAWNHSLQFSFTRRFRQGLQFGFNDAIILSASSNQALRLEHSPDGTLRVRSDQAEADKLLGSGVSQRQLMKANFVWDLPDIKSQNGLMRPLGWVANDWQLSGIWTGQSGATYTVGFSYANGGSSSNLTGSPDYAARIRVTGDPGAGCSSDIYRQFNTAGFQGPLVNSVGLESGTDYLRGCLSTLDLAIARNIRLPKGRNIQLRVDMFNAPNSAAIDGRNTTLSLSSPSDPLTNTAPVFDPITGKLNNGINLLSTGAVSPDRSLPKNAGFGVANSYQNPRSIQFQVRFQF